MKLETAVSVRPAETTEVGAVTSIMLAAFSGNENVRLGAGYARAYIESFLRAEARSLLIAHQCGEIVGFAAAEDSRLRADRYRELRSAAAAALLRRPWLALNADILRMARQRLAMKRREPLPDSWFLSLIGVRPDAQGRGVGRALLQAFENEGRSRHFEQATLFVRDNNLPALALYESSGWQRCGSSAEHRATLQLVLADEVKPAFARAGHV